jgi:hypothetical protein
MHKSILTITMLTIASSCYSLVLNKAVVLGHQSWVNGGDNNGGAILGYLENEFTVLSSSSSTVSARTSNVNGVINTNIYTKGAHSYSVNNTSSTYQIYTIDLKLCANSTYCFHDQTRIGVEKGGYFSNYATSYLTCMFSYEGNYNLQATTYITGDTSSSDVGRATIYVKR